MNRLTGGEQVCVPRGGFLVFVRLENTTDHEILAMANDFRRINDHEPMHSLLAYLSERRRKAAGTDPGPQAA